MKVAYTLCGLAILLQATQADARSAFRSGQAQEAPEDSFASESTMTTSENEPFVPAEASGDESFMSASSKADEVGGSTLSNDDDLPPQGYSGENYGGYSGEISSEYDEPSEILVAPEIEEPTPYESSWEDLHPPGWNGLGFPEGYENNDDSKWQNVEIDAPQYYVDEPTPDSQPNHDPHQYETGWSKDSLPPWARHGYFGDNNDGYSGENYNQPPEILVAPEIEEPTPYEPSWDDLHPPGWNDDGLPPQYRDGYSGDDNNYEPQPAIAIGEYGVQPPMYPGDNWDYQENEPERPVVIDQPEYLEKQQQFITGGPGVALPPLGHFARPHFYLKPSSPVVPSFDALDADGDDVVTPDEWTASVEELKATAKEKAASSRDPHAKQLLDDIIDFHYANLHACMAQGVKVLSSPSYHAYDLTNPMSNLLIHVCAHLVASRVAGGHASGVQRHLVELLRQVPLLALCGRRALRVDRAQAVGDLGRADQQVVPQAVQHRAERRRPWAHSPRIAAGRAVHHEEHLVSRQHPRRSRKQYWEWIALALTHNSLGELMPFDFLILGSIGRNDVRQRQVLQPRGRYARLRQHRRITRTPLSSSSSSTHRINRLHILAIQHPLCELVSLDLYLPSCRGEVPQSMYIASNKEIIHNATPSSFLVSLPACAREPATHGGLVSKTVSAVTSCIFSTCSFQ